MSYCVNCGVELDKTASVCPLCKTPVCNPNHPADTNSPKPFPTQKGELEKVTRKDKSILTTSVLASIAVTCGMLNLFVFKSSVWSLYIIGACILIWILILPFLIYTTLNNKLSILFDGLGAGMFCAIISFIYPGNGWYLHICLPIIVLTTLLIEIYIFYITHFKNSVLTKIRLILSEISVLCIGIELFIDLYLLDKIALTWSAVVLSCSIIIIITLSIIVSQSHLREEIRRRGHF